jgi:hypothetical protein
VSGVRRGILKAIIVVVNLVISHEKPAIAKKDNTTVDIIDYCGLIVQGPDGSNQLVTEGQVFVSGIRDLRYWHGLFGIEVKVFEQANDCCNEPNQQCGKKCFQIGIPNLELAGNSQEGDDRRRSEYADEDEK